MDTYRNMRGHHTHKIINYHTIIYIDLGVHIYYYVCVMFFYRKLIIIVT